MATVPTHTTPQIRVDRTPAPTIALDPGAGAFGERQAVGLQQAGQQLTQLGDEFAEQRRRLQAREDSLRRLQTLSALQTQAQELVLAEQQGGNMANPDNVAALRTRLGDLFTKAQENYQGGLPEDKILFRESVTQMQSRFGNAVTEMGIVAGRAAMDQELEARVVQYAAMVHANPSSMPDVLTDFNRWYRDNMADTVEAHQEAAHKMAAYQMIVGGKMQFLLDNLQFDEVIAQSLDPTVAPLLGYDGIKYRMLAYDGLKKQKERQVEVDAKLDLIRAAIPNAEEQPWWSEAVTTAALGMNLASFGKQTKLTTADKVFEYEQMMARVLKKPDYTASAEEVARIYSAYGDPGTPELSEDRRIISNFNLKYRSGDEITPQDLSTYLGALAGLMTENQFGVRGELDAETRVTLDDMGLTPKDLVDPSGLPKVRDLLEQYSGQMAQRPGVAAAEPEMPAPLQQKAQQVRQAAQAAEQAGEPVQAITAFADAGVKWFHVVDDLAGPIAATGRGLANLPIVGSILEAPTMLALKQDWDIFLAQIGDALERTGRESNAERQAVMTEQLQELKTRFWQNPNAFRHRMIGLDTNMAREMEQLRETLAREGEVSAERRKDMQDRLEALRQIRRALHVPPEVRTVEEFQDTVSQLGLTPEDYVRAHGMIVTVQEVLDTLAGIDEEEEPE